MPESAKTITAVFLNGKIVLDTEALISISDQGLLFGWGFFETFRTSGGRPHHWRFNRRRLEQACARSGLLLPSSFLACDEAKLQRAVTALLDALGERDAVFRYTVTAGSGEGPSEFLAVRSLPSPPSASGICLRILAVRRDSGEWIPRPKSVNYLNATLGLRELQNRNVATSDEGLFLSRDDDSVTETPRQNIGWVRADRIYCPADIVGCVPGSCVAWMLSRGEPIEPVRAPLSQLLEAEAIFTCNAVRGVTPVREVWDASDALQLGSFDSVNHPVVERLRQGWNDSLLETAQGRR